MSVEVWCWADGWLWLVPDVNALEPRLLKKARPRDVRRTSGSHPRLV
ncbi:hypothetical protein PV336_27265 [Streptomyces sp. MI02-2A]|nr:hypothetical protein [Streptomyces sp. MI02-2A]MDX3262883.1 hypothetical protein [Streptomyces sp. MI02-2A]